MVFKPILNFEKVQKRPQYAMAGLKRHSRFHVGLILKLVNSFIFPRDKYKTSAFVRDKMMVDSSLQLIEETMSIEFSVYVYFYLWCKLLCSNITLIRITKLTLLLDCGS